MVPLRMKMGENPGAASFVMARSALTFDRAYSVFGSNGDSSVTMSVLDAPYMMHEEEKRNRLTPAAFASSASLTEAWKLMSSVQESFRFPIGSLLRAARWMTAS